MQSEYVRSIKKYIVHLPDSSRRKGMVSDIMQVTGAEVYDAIRAKDGAIGCYLSHLEIMKKDPGESVIIFEDDCIINDKNMLSLLDIHKDYDLLFFGVNRMFERGNKEKNSNFAEGTLLNSFGTHAMWVSVKAKEIFLEYMKNKSYFKPLDGLWNIIENEFNLKVWRPADGEIYRYCEQKVGELSIIDGKLRKDFYSKESWINRKCQEPSCPYKVHPDVKNNFGTHCCLGCKRGEVHGPLCPKVVWKATK